MKSDKKIANAVSGRTARACDCCIRRRARWYCTADDAFLCQTCDLSVHSANPLARRHQRVRLKTASTSLKRVDPLDLPSWQRGLTRKARTPRHGKHPGLLHHQGSKYEDSTGQNPLRIVPELGAEDTTCSHEDENDDQLLYRVPIFDPFVPELCTSTTSTPVMEVESFGDVKSHDVKSCFQPLDMDLEEFAADVETLLGKGLDEESYGIEELGLLNSCENSRDMEGRINFNFGYGGVVKAENNDQLRDDVGGEEFALRDPCNLGFDVYGEEFATTCQDYQEDQKVMKVESIMAGEDRHGFSKLKEDDDEKDRELVKKRKISLTLDYEAISEAWASQSQSSPWINGQRPDFNPDDCWLHGLGTSGMELEHPLFGGRGGHGGVMGDGGREARVLRYREKRRTRLFAKKIRYEVRKLNAEKRPRMKGRFVKRSSFPHPPTTTAPVALLSK